MNVVVTTSLPAAVGGVLLAVAVLAVVVVLVRRDRRRAVEAALARGAAAAREADRAAHRRFLQRLDHEMKNPVTAVRAALTGLVPDPAALPSEQAHAHATLEQQTTRLWRLVADLRKLAELETAVLEQEDVDLAQVLHDVAADLGDQAAASGVPRTIDVVVPRTPWPLPHVRGDVDLLYLAVHNVLGNALKYSPAGSAVEVRATDDVDHVVVEVADVGMGIPEHELPVVLEELTRGEGARGTPGSGLGLALVRVVVERHGGSLTLRSRPGTGTSVRIRLPVLG